MNERLERVKQPPLTSMERDALRVQTRVSQWLRSQAEAGAEDTPKETDLLAAADSKYQLELFMRKAEIYTRTQPPVMMSVL